MGALKELGQRRELLYSMTVRELKVRYKQSLLGAGWAVLQPLALMALFTLVFSKFAGVPSEGVPYPVFSYTALLPWTLFSTSLSFAIPSLVSNANLIQKVRLPTEIFPMACILAALVDFGIAITVLLAMVAVYRLPLSWNALYLVPILAIQLIFTLALALLASAINVFYRDVKYAVPLGMQLWMFASPVAYPVSIVPANYRALYMLNPMATIIESYRTVLLNSSPPSVMALCIVGVGSVVLLLPCYGYFKRKERAFADVI